MDRYAVNRSNGYDAAATSPVTRSMSRSTAEAAQQRSHFNFAPPQPSPVRTSSYMQQPGQQHGRVVAALRACNSRNLPLLVPSTC